MRWRSCRSRSPLSPLLYPEMTRCAALPLPPCRAVLMRFDRGDDLNLNDHPKTWNLPDGALALLTRASEWCAHNLKYGFVPAEMLARFSSDPVQAVEELLRRGLWRRVKGGYQYCEWGLFGKTAEQAAQEEEDAEAKRAYDAERQRRSRANRKAAVTGMSHVTSGDTAIDRSDQDLSIASKSKSGLKSKSDARASDADDPKLVAAVASAICAVVAFLPDDDQARAVIRIFEERARKAGTRIRSKVAYYTTSVRNEPELWKHILTDPAPIAEPEPAAPPPPGSRDPNWHEFESPGGDGVCWCKSTRKSPRHYPEPAESQCLA